MIFGASKIETKTTITSSGGEVTVGDFTSVIRTSVNNTFDSDVQNIAKNLCAGDYDGYDLSKLEIFYLAEDRSASTDLTFGSGVVLEAVRFRLNGVEQDFNRAPTDIDDVNGNVGPIADSVSSSPL